MIHCDPQKIIAESNTACQESLVYHWRQRTLYTGPPYYSRDRYYLTDALIIGFEGPFLIRDHQTPDLVECRLALVPATTGFFMDLQGHSFGILYLDHYGQDCRQLKKLSRARSGNIYTGFGPDLTSCVTQCVVKIHANHASIEQAEELLDILELDRFFDQYDTEGCPRNLDPRLCTVISMYIDGKLRVDSLINEVAAKVNLSESRLVKLFREELGINFREFRYRMQTYCFFIATGFGKSNSQAALDAGFVDQAHFCKRFKQTVGMNASTYYQENVKRIYHFDAELRKRYVRGDGLFGAL